MVMQVPGLARRHRNAVELRELIDSIKELKDKIILIDVCGTCNMYFMTIRV